jgi:hypothetical protein
VYEAYPTLKISMDFKSFRQLPKIAGYRKEFYNDEMVLTPRLPVKGYKGQLRTL